MIMKTLLLFVVLMLSAGCAAICPLDAAKDKSIECEVMAGDRCVQYARHGSLRNQTNKFGR